MRIRQIGVGGPSSYVWSQLHRSGKGVRWNCTQREAPRDRHAAQASGTASRSALPPPPPEMGGGEPSKGKGGGKGGGKGKGAKGKGKGDSDGGDRPASAPPGGRGGGGGGGGGRGGGAGGKGGPKAKVGDTREMGGVTLVAVAKDGQIAWEPVGGMDSQASRDAQRRAAQDEARSLRDTASAIKDQRVAEARDDERKERQRKAQLLGSDAVYRTSKAPTYPNP